MNCLNKNCPHGVTSDCGDTHLCDGFIPACKKKWLVRRYVVEEYFVEADSRAEALKKAEEVNIYTSRVERETCVSRDWFNEHKEMCEKTHGNKAKGGETWKRK